MEGCESGALLEELQVELCRGGGLETAAVHVRVPVYRGALRHGSGSKVCSKGAVAGGVARGVAGALFRAPPAASSSAARRSAAVLTTTASFFTGEKPRGKTS